MPAELRRKNQMMLLKNNYELQVGSLLEFPLTLEEVKAIDEHSRYVVSVNQSGLSAIVYQIKVQGRMYNIKKRREEILVQNIDGQTSFINEVQRRYEFEQLRKQNDVLRKGIVQTIYASIKHGVIVSEWIEGEHPRHFSKHLVHQLFELLFNMEIHSIFEWDVSLGNILVDEHQQIKLYDFGYCYHYNPLKMYNPDGLESPLFHMVERFESRTYMQYLLELSLTQGSDALYEAYRQEKEEAIHIYERKVAYLKKHQGLHEIINLYQGFILRWKDALRNQKLLIKQYQLDAFRSYKIEIHDDLSGKTCTPYTLMKVDEMLRLLEEQYEFLKENEAFIWGDETKTKQELIAHYQEERKKIQQYQVERPKNIE